MPVSKNKPAGKSTIDSKSPSKKVVSKKDVIAPIKAHVKRRHNRVPFSPVPPPPAEIATDTSIPESKQPELKKQPFIVELYNTTQHEVSNFRLLYPYEFMGHEGFKDGKLTIDGVVISSSVPFTPYNGLLQQFAALPVTIGKTKVIFDRNIAQDFWLGINMKYANGDERTNSISLQSDDSVFFSNNNEFITEFPYLVDGGTSLIISKIPPNARVIVCLFPAEEGVVGMENKPIGTGNNEPRPYIFRVLNKSKQIKPNFKILSPLAYFTNPGVKDGVLTIGDVEISSLISNVSYKHLLGHLQYNPATIGLTMLNFANYDREWPASSSINKLNKILKLPKCKIPKKLSFEVCCRDANGNMAQRPISLITKEYKKQPQKGVFELKQPYRIDGLTSLSIDLPGQADLYVYLYPYSIISSRTLSGYETVTVVGEKDTEEATAPAASHMSTDEYLIERLKEVATTEDYAGFQMWYRSTFHLIEAQKSAAKLLGIAEDASVEQIYHHAKGLSTLERLAASQRKTTAANHMSTDEYLIACLKEAAVKKDYTAFYKWYHNTSKALKIIIARLLELPENPTIEQVYHLAKGLPNSKKQDAYEASLIRMLKKAAKDDFESFAYWYKTIFISLVAVVPTGKTTGELLGINKKSSVLTIYDFLRINKQRKKTVAPKAKATVKKTTPTTKKKPIKNKPKK